MASAIIFDFDGVIADSEVLANAVLAEFVTELGMPTTVEDSYRDYMGKRFNEVVAAVENAVGHAIPQSFGEQWQVRTLARFQARSCTNCGCAGVHRKIRRYAPLHRIVLDATMARGVLSSKP